MRCFAGYILIPDCRHETALVCYGPTETGKSTIAAGIEAVLGDDLITKISLSQLCHPQNKNLAKVAGVALNLSIDTASSRADIVAVTQKLALKKIAIIGLGGTGSYVLDLLAKTPVREIHLYDGDAYLQHNAFRSPGAPSTDDLKAKQFKVTYFKDLYSKMHRGIVDHPFHIDAGNVEELRGMDFVFIRIDKGSAKKLIVEKLEEFNLPFVDVGMGVQFDGQSLAGIVRVTASTETATPFACCCSSLPSGCTNCLRRWRSPIWTPG